MQVIYELYHIHEILEDGEEDNVKLLGIFSSKEKVERAIERYKKLPGFKERSEIFSDDCGVGFFIDESKLDRESWCEGYVTVGESMSSLHGTTVEDDYDEPVGDININIPYGAKDVVLEVAKQQSIAEQTEEYASRVIEEHFGKIFEYPKGPGSEFFQLREAINHILTK